MPCVFSSGAAAAATAAAVLQAALAALQWSAGQGKCTLMFEHTNMVPAQVLIQENNQVVDWGTSLPLR
jgi:alpha/beta superfamily hydrolase